MTATARSSGSAARSRRDGFMLVEMLVAMAVGAFLLVALASLTGFLLRAHDRVMRQAQDVESSTRALAALSREIEEALPMRWAGGKGFVFAGSPDRLLLARNESASDGVGHIKAVLFQIAARNESTLIARTEGVLPPGAASPDAVPWTAAVELYAGTARVSFAFFVPLDGGGEALVDTWPPEGRMPSAVRVSFSPADPGASALSQRIRLVVDAAPDCVLPDAASCEGSRADESQVSEPSAAAPVDADDPLGWSRYVR